VRHAELIASLSDACAYPWHGRTTPVVTVQTATGTRLQIGGDRFELLRETDAQTQRRWCEATLACNRALAPGVYLGVAALLADPRSGVRVERPPFARPHALPVLGWLLWSRRLPASASLSSLLERRVLARPQLWSLATTLATFYAGHEHPAADLAATSAANDTHLDELEIIFSARAGTAPRLFDPALLEVLRHTNERSLARTRGLFGATSDRRPPTSHTAREDPCPTHGDLRLDHIHQLAAHIEPELVDDQLVDLARSRDLMITDRIADPGSRCTTPIADIAGVVVDLQLRGAWALARCFSADFLSVYDEPKGDQVLAFQVGARALERAAATAATHSLETFQVGARSPRSRVTPGHLGPATAPDPNQEQGQAGALVRLALTSLSPPRARPCLVIIAGLPGTGKSNLARMLRETGHFAWVHSDDIGRLSLGANNLDRPGDGQDSAQTYDACLHCVRAICRVGGRTIVDAGFLDQAQREAFVSAAAELGILVYMLVVTAPDELVRARFAQRDTDSEEAWSRYLQARKRWARIDPMLCPTSTIAGSADPRDPLNEACAALTKAGLL